MIHLKYIVLLLLLLSLQQCTTPVPPPIEPDYQYDIDEILHDPKIDGNYAICNPDNEIFQYFNDSKGMKFKGENKAINDHFTAGYQPPAKSNESGLVRIRFVVNCNGEPGRYRLMAMDELYKAKVFDIQITDQLLKLTKSLKGWGTLVWQEIPRDYYQYLIFKIENGSITKILP